MFMGSMPRPKKDRISTVQYLIRWIWGGGVVLGSVKSMNYAEKRVQKKKGKAPYHLVRGLLVC